MELTESEDSNGKYTTAHFTSWQIVSHYFLWYASYLILHCPGWATLVVISRTGWVKSSVVWLALVPVCASWLSNLEGPVQITLGTKSYDIPLELPFSWIAFYFGAVCFSLALFFLYVSCPEIIRQFESFNGFREQGREGRYLLSQLNYHRLTPESLRGQVMRDNEEFRSEAGLELCRFVNDFCVDGVFPADASDLYIRYVHGEGISESNQPVTADRATIPERSRLAKELNLATNDWRYYFETGLPLPFVVREECFPEAFWRVREVCDDAYFGARYIVSRLFYAGYALHIWVALQGFWYVLKVALPSVYRISS